MKKLLIMCGAGHATSTVVRTKVNRWLKEEGLENQVEIKQSAVGQELESIKNGEYDIVLSTTQVPDDIKDKVIMGVQLLSGFGAEAVYVSLKEKILK